MALRVSFCRVGIVTDAVVVTEHPAVVQVWAFAVAEKARPRTAARATVKRLRIVRSFRLIVFTSGLNQSICRRLPKATGVPTAQSRCTVKIFYVFGLMGGEIIVLVL